MRILHTESSLGWGGQEIRILNESAGMIARGHQVNLVCSPDASIYREAQRRAIPVKTLPIAKKNLTGLLAMRRYLQTDPPDVVNTHSSTDSWLVALASASLRNAPPLVRTRHISAPLPNNAATRWLYGRATRHIVTTGEMLKRQLLDLRGLDERAITSVPTGIDIHFFKAGDRKQARAQLKLPAQADIIGIVATLRSWKGHRFLIEALQHLQRTNIFLVVVGDGPQRDALEQQVRQFNGQAQVVFAGAQNNVLPWLQALNIFALPSYANEGVPQALLQAMAVGVPCITTDAGAINEIARDQETALIVPLQDAKAIARGIERLLADTEHVVRLTQRARAEVCARFNIENMLDKMETIFRNVGKDRHGETI